jgi:hypothetical protein
MRKFTLYTKEANTVTEDRSNQPQIQVRPLTDEEVERMGEFLKKAKALREKIRTRRKGKPLPSSWKLIRDEREKRSKRIWTTLT